MSATCAFCGRPAEGNFAVERDGFLHGAPEVDLCDACGRDEAPTLREIWARIGQSDVCLDCEEDIRPGDERRGSFHTWCYEQPAAARAS